MTSPPLSRTDFIQQAGGVFTAEMGYHDWAGAEKWDNFWAFFSDTQHQWVPSLYGEIPISTLRKHRRHSIEHIIPRSTLEDILGADTLHFNGASTNPFNMAPSDRFLNKTRSSFPFDLEGDRVDSPFDIYLNPKAKGTTGLDADDEWVVPHRSRGDIARSVLYMTVIYDLDELYQVHLTTLLRWAQQDQPMAWEKSYNQWVQDKFEICNPLITLPIESFQFF